MNLPSAPSHLDEFINDQQDLGWQFFEDWLVNDGLFHLLINFGQQHGICGII
jgi:hypothetical protein